MYVLYTGRASSKIILCTSACKSGSDRDHDMNGDSGNHGKRSDPALGDNGEINRDKIPEHEKIKQTPANAPRPFPAEIPFPRTQSPIVMKSRQYTPQVLAEKSQQ